MSNIFFPLRTNSYNLPKIAKMDIEKGLSKKRNNKNLIRSTIFSVVKKLNHLPIIFLGIFFVTSFLKCNNLIIITALLTVIVIQIVILLYKKRKRDKKYS